ncbi:MAG: hypothetical protein AB8B62_17645 [Roseobacter sp.]
MNNSGAIEVTVGSWLAALAVGMIAGTAIGVLGGWSFTQSCFAGGFIFVVVGAVLNWSLTRPMPAPNTATLETPTIASSAASKKAPAPAAAPVKAAPVSAAPAPTVARAKVQPSKALEGEAELAARKGNWKYEAEEVAKPVAKKKAPAKKAAAKKAAPKRAVAADARPAMMLDAPEGDAADDLKKISGVGPKLEQTLNDLGIWHYAQVAQFKKKDIAWVDERLRFKGRIERDDWVGQAKKLAKAKG